jgi:DNA polymerase-3 subunit epsilon
LAHNAGFDTPMIESVHEINEISGSKIWACSFVQVDWAAKGFLSSKQELLSIFHGFHYAGHRALLDIDALANILLQGDYLKEILQNVKTKQVTVDCIKAPFESKDLLKAKGFSWDGENKFWTKLIPETEIESMKTFLEDKVYPRGKMTAEFVLINHRDRFKA